MILKYFVILTLATIALVCTPRASAAVIIQRPLYVGLTSGLVGAWSFDGPDMTKTTAIDHSGSYATGTLTNGPVRAIGKIGQALEFDGVDDHVAVGTRSVFFSLGEMTASAWIKPSSVAQDVAGREIVTTGNTNTSDIFRFEINRTAGRLIAVWGGTVILTGNTTMNADTWYHAVMVRSGSSGAWTATLYLNGVKDGSVAVATNPSTGSAPTYIGALNGPSRVFPGLIDDVRIYNRVLSPQEIQRLYKIGSTFKVNAPKYTDSLTKGLVGAWSFDGATMGTTSAYDLSGNNKTGWLTNGPKKVAGKIGQALAFDGRDDYVGLGNGLDQTGEVSISAWFKTNTVAVAGASDAIVSNSTGSGSGDYACEINRTPGKLSLQWETTQHAIGATLLKKNTWYHAVCVRSGSSGNWTARVYLDGVLDGSGTTASDATSPTNQTMIGSRSGGDSLFFDGLIDDVRIYNRALSPAEIQRLYQIGR